MKTFTTADFEALGVCGAGLERVAAFGGAIENTHEGWQAYIDANPDAWRAPLFTAARLHKRGDISCPDLIWRVARIAFREQPDQNAHLRIYAETLGPDNWREARVAAHAAADAADDAGDADAFDAAHAAADAAHAAAADADDAGDADAFDAAHAAADAAHAAADAAHAATYAASAGAVARAADTNARPRVRAEIIAMALTAMAELTD